MCPSTEGINNRKLERTLFCHVQRGWQLIQNTPFIYSANMPPASLAAKFPMLTRVMEGERPSWYSITLGDWRQAVFKERGEGNSLSVYLFICVYLLRERERERPHVLRENEKKL